MVRPTTTRLLIDQPADGAWNMAVDEALLESVAKSGIPALRLYQWQHPTLSLGYFQRLVTRDTHHESRLCPLVRRSSGGGAIVHDQELTYSLVIPEKLALYQQRQQFYQQVHGVLIDVLAELGIRANLCSSSEDYSLCELPFLCFLRRSAGDVLVDKRKVAGSAQRRHRGALLQHGSILLNTSPVAPQIAGINENAGSQLQFSDLADIWPVSLANKLFLTLEPGDLSSLEHHRAAQLIAKKHLSETWLNRH